MMKFINVSAFLVVLFGCFWIGLSAAIGEESSTEVVVDVLGKSKKFDKAAITKEENKVLHGVFASAHGGTIESLTAENNGGILISGQFGMGTEPSGGAAIVEPAGKEGRAFVGRLSADMRKLEVLFRLPPDFLSASRVALWPDGSIAVAGKSKDGGVLVGRISAGLDAVAWIRKVIGEDVAGISIAPDGSVLVCPEKAPFVSRVASDGKSLIPFGESETFRFDGANPKIQAAWWDGLGYATMGYQGKTYLQGGCGGVVALPDNTFALIVSNYVRMPSGGPDFDLMLLRFDGGGNVLGCSNLLDGMPAPSDQKSPRMSLDPYTGDLLVAAIHHGHFEHNLIATKGAYLTPHEWKTGDIMIGWIGRVDSTTLQPKASTFYFPQLAEAGPDGKKRANSLFPEALVSDRDGNIYVTGASAWKLPTTLHAFQSEPLGGSGFLSVFDRNLTKVLYASLITSKGASFHCNAVALSPGGPVVSAELTVKPGSEGEFVNANTDSTNFMAPLPSAPSGSFLGYYPSGAWIPK